MCLFGIYWRLSWLLRLPMILEAWPDLTRFTLTYLNIYLSQEWLWSVYEPRENKTVLNYITVRSSNNVIHSAFSKYENIMQCTSLLSDLVFNFRWCLRVTVACRWSWGWTVYIYLFLGRARVWRKSWCLKLYCHFLKPDKHCTYWTGHLCVWN